MRRPAVLICALSVLMALVVTCVNEKHCKLYYEAGKIVEINGVVLSADEKEADEKYRLEVKTDSGDKILVTLIGDPADIRYENGVAIETYYNLVGRDINFRSYIELPAGRRNPQCFDYSMYLRSRGIEVISTVRAVQIEVGSESGSLYHKYLAAVAGYKGRFTERVTETAGTGRSALICAMMFGDKDLIDDEMYEEFQKNGTAHVLAVSGLHVGAVYAYINRLVGKSKKKLACVVNASLLIVYAAMASFAPSVMRAVTMIIIHMIGSAGSRRYDMLSASCVCMAATLIRNPYMLYNAGFQMSYLAVFSITIIGGALKEHLGGSILPMISVQIGMFPAISYMFNYFSIGAFIANLPIIFLTGLIIPFGLLLMIMLPVCEYIGAGFALADILISVPVILSDIIIYINEFTYAGGRLTFDVVSPDVFTMILYYGIVFGGCSEHVLIWYRRRRYKLIVVALAVLVLTAGLAGILCDNEFEDAGLVFVDVGQGDCLHVRTQDGKNYLVDGGGSATYDVGKNTLKPYLLKNGVRKVDMAIVTHLHTDHYQGIVSLCRDGMVKKLCVYEGNAVNEDVILAETSMKKEDIVYVKEGDVLTLGKNVQAEIISPPRMTEAEYRILAQTDDENRNSLILRLEYGEISVLMTGDIDSDAERELIARYAGDLECTILKAAHHGSRYSSCDEFLAATNPKLIVFQVGRNNYGHPDKTLIEKCEQNGIMVYRNDQDGAIAITNINRRAKVITMNE